MIHLRQLGPAFIRHVEAYGLLAVAAARDLRAIALRRMLLVAIGAVLGIAAVVLLGATLIAAGWETPYRGWVAGGVLAVLAAAALGCLAAASGELPSSTHLQALKQEWQKDRAWLATRGDRRAGDRDLQGERGLPTDVARRGNEPERVVTPLRGN